jgi:integrase
VTIIHRSLPTESAPYLGPTLLDVREAIAIKESLSEQVRRNLISNVNTLCRVLDRQPHQVPASLNLLRPMIDVASPGAIHVSQRNWQNIKSGVTRAINLCGFSASFIPKDAPIDECWAPVIARAKGTQIKCFLRRFARFCSSVRVTPTEVTDELMPEYFAFLKNVGSKAPLTCSDSLIRHWNEIRLANPELKLAPLTVAKRSHTYARAWDDLPTSLASDAAAFKAAIVKIDLFAENSRRPVRQSTAEQYHRQIRRLASACLLNGATAEDIASLGRLVSPETLQLGLSYLWPKDSGDANQQVHDMAHLALLIAKYWAKLPADVITEIKRIAGKCKVNRKGLAKKVRERLRQFRDQGVILKLMQLPEQLLAAARRMPPNCRSAMLVQEAAVIAILIDAPIRIGNLRCLDRARHFQALFSTKEPGMQLVLSKEEVKNDVDLEYPLAPSTIALIDVYMKEYQPLLCGESESSFLFPGRGGKPKTDGKLRDQIIDTVRKHVGVHVHPHLFRHLAALIFLEAHPGCYEDVRRLLGHKRIQTTINFYAGLEGAAAVKRYHTVIARYQMTPDKEVARQ